MLDYRQTDKLTVEKKRKKKRKETISGWNVTQLCLT